MCQSGTNGALLRVHLSRNCVDTVLYLEGELDISSTEVLNEMVAELDGDLSGRYVVDLDGLEFLDCGGLRGLLDLAQEATAQGGRLIVTRPRGKVARVLSLVGPAEWTQPA